MAKRVLFFGSLALAILAAYTLKTAVADKETKEFKATCPVSGKAAKKESSLNYSRGKKVYFCCDNCPKAFKADRKKFAAKANLQLLQTGQIVQVVCPLLGKPMNKSKTIKISGTEVALCCGAPWRLSACCPGLGTGLAVFAPKTTPSLPDRPKAISKIASNNVIFSLDYTSLWA